MDHRTLFADFFARFEDAPSPGRTIAHTIWPGSLGGRRTKANTVYVNAREALHAYAIMWRCPGVPTLARRRYARFLLARLNAPEMLHLAGRRSWLLRAIAPYTSGANSLHAAPIFAKLWHVDGRVAEGNQPDLAAQTGLEQRRVRDLVCGRRSYASGWCTSKNETILGYRKKGRKAKEQFFV